MLGQKVLFASDALQRWATLDLLMLNLPLFDFFGSGAGLLELDLFLDYKENR